MTRPTLEFWYEFGSTYSYPAAMRVERVAGAAGVALRWRPFLLGPIFGAKGQTDSPFNTDPVKGRYMWRELARICRREGIPLVLPPARFVQNSLKAARLALVGETEGWTPAFSRAVYAANFAEQKDISEDATLISILSGLGADAGRAMTAAGSPEIKAQLKAQTEQAMAREIFGAPFFMVGDEPFWGNDRLEEAVAFAAARQGAD
jgi:2-hydroxychromene-2-carboxylate isomerase